MISDKTIQEVLQRIDIVEVIGEFVNLKRSGSNYKGLCPFHKEKTPSFVVSPSKQIFKCFGCGASGSAISFLMKHEHFTYPEAIRWLAKKYNIEIEETEDDEESRQKRQERESIFTVNTFAQKYFTHNLFFEDEGISVGLGYLRHRGFRDEIIEKFQLGYALNQRDGFTQHAIKQGYKLDTLSKAGLTIIKETNYFDRFWARVIFPIHSLTGQIIGFAGRILDKDKSPAKYLNSPETEVFQKRKILYGLYFAKKSITQEKKCYLVEGYTDVLSFHQAGIENTVASLGTSLTEDHVNLIHRFTDNLTLIFDGDSAGIKAAMRGIDIALKEDLNLKVVLLPNGEDPDSFSKKNAPADVREYIETHEQDFITFKAGFLLQDNADDPYKRSEAIRNMAKTLAVVSDPVRREIFIKRAAEVFGISSDSLASEVMRIYKSNITQLSRGKVSTHTPDRKTPVLPSTIQTTALPEEKELIEYLLRYGNRIYEERQTESGEKVPITVADFIITELTNENLEFKNLFYKEVFEEIKKLREQGKDFDIKYFQSHPDQRFQELANELLANDYEISRIWEKRGGEATHPHEHYKEFTLSALLSYKLRIVSLEIGRLGKLQQVPADNLEMAVDIEDRYKKLYAIQQELQKIKRELFGEHRIILPNTGL